MLIITHSGAIRAVVVVGILQERHNHRLRKILRYHLGIARRRQGAGGGRRIVGMVESVRCLFFSPSLWTDYWKQASIPWLLFRTPRTLAAHGVGYDQATARGLTTPAVNAFNTLSDVVTVSFFTEPAQNPSTSPSIPYLPSTVRMYIHLNYLKEHPKQRGCYLCTSDNSYVPIAI